LTNTNLFDKENDMKRIKVKFVSWYRNKEGYAFVSISEKYPHNGYMSYSVYKRLTDELCYAGLDYIKIANNRINDVRVYDKNNSFIALID
jgi:hypothetical protein